MKTPGNTNKKVLGRLIDEVEGVKLPEVTEDDNGSVLTVVEGAWDKAEPSGGSGGIFTVSCEHTSGEYLSNVYRLNKTWNEIHDAITAGMLVYAVGEDYYSALKEIYYYESDEIPFYCVEFGTQVAEGHVLASNGGDAYLEYSS